MPFALSTVIVPPDLIAFSILVQVVLLLWAVAKSPVYTTVSPSAAVTVIFASPESLNSKSPLDTTNRLSVALAPSSRTLPSYPSVGLTLITPPRLPVISLSNLITRWIGSSPSSFTPAFKFNVPWLWISLETALVKSTVTSPVSSSRVIVAPDLLLPSKITSFVSAFIVAVPLFQIAPPCVPAMLPVKVGSIIVIVPALYIAPPCVPAMLPVKVSPVIVAITTLSIAPPTVVA